MDKQELPTSIGPLFERPKKEGQCVKLLRYFKAGGTVTSFEAYMKFGITQLGRCISDLERAGHSFNRPKVKINDKIVCRYSLIRGGF